MLVFFQMRTEPVLARKFAFATANWTTELLWESMHVLGVSYKSFHPRKILMFATSFPLVDKAGLPLLDMLKFDVIHEELNLVERMMVCTVFPLARFWDKR